MKRTAMPGIYPMPGNYSVAYMSFYLGCATPGARIHYTTDGTEPTIESPVFDAHKTGPVYMLGFTEQPEGGEKHVTVRAMAESDGAEPSRTAVFDYTFYTTAPGNFTYELLREGSEELPALYRICDYCRSNMFLVVGSERAMLIDGGLDSGTDIKPFIDDLTGGLPVDLFVTHGHLDHNAATWSFLGHGCKVYLSSLDKPTYLAGGGKACPEGTTDIYDGESFELGNTRLTAYFLPGHTPGGYVIIDEKTGDLFASDELVNNDPYGPNSLLLGLTDDEESSLEAYCERIEHIWQMIKGKAKRIWTGHNTFSHDADMYMTNLIAAIRNVLENGEDALVPDIRPSAEMNAMVGYRDYKTDICSFAVSVKYLYRKDAREGKKVKYFNFE